jgi:PHD/YefM family antitoxin component YafN of YafNO toxin-antitoxin module
MKTLSVHDDIDLPSLAYQASKEPISLSDEGKPVGVIISMEAYKVFLSYVSEDKGSRSKIEAFRKAVKDAQSAAVDVDVDVDVDEEDYYKQYIES